MEEAIKLAIEKGGMDRGIYNNKEYLVLQPGFWQALGKGLGWGQDIYKTESGQEWGKRICLHCNTDVEYQPKMESGCNHAHYPEACEVCSAKTITWKQQALRFFELKLTGGDEQKFWAELLTQ